MTMRETPTMTTRSDTSTKTRATRPWWRRKRWYALTAGLIAVAVLAFVLFAPTSSNTISKGGLPSITAGTQYGEKPTLAKGKGTAPTSLKTEVISQGDGTTLKDGMSVSVDYLGQTWDSTKPFDNSYDRDQKFTFILGEGQVIKGWDQALKGQKQGSRLEVSIPPSLGYGAAVQSGIPANSTLIFVIDIDSAKAG
ncbi:FKBP-type peptidyl-prolyl cis-trans isomerase [Streptomyces fractus]|uniref:FKBP-type peptidyl-prolyl cis-trans isomerase n=1 Tax=Streptomyces fractus TaxID=641806 RepID=UPI003CF473BF